METPSDQDERETKAGGTQQSLDHMIFLAADLDTASSKLSSLGFTVLPGGQHADGKTSNILIILQDGVYLEFIAFADEAAKAGHWWGTKHEGWIDWCLAGTVPESTQGYDKAMTGGRKTTQGKDIQWAVTFPDKELPRGRMPFFCQDITDREDRVSLLYMLLLFKMLTVCLGPTCVQSSRKRC